MRAPSPRARGQRVGTRGSLAGRRLAAVSEALSPTPHPQNRGGAPASLPLRSSTSPRTRGEVMNSDPVPARARRARVMSNSVFCLPLPVAGSSERYPVPIERAFTSCCGATLRSPPATKERREAERRQTQAVHARTHTACGARHGMSGLRRPSASGALACRRSTAALAKGCVVPWCAPGQASWAEPPRGGHDRRRRPTSSGAPRIPVVMPAGMMPGPPGSKADEAPPAGTALAPAARHHPDGVPLGRDDFAHVI